MTLTFELSQAEDGSWVLSSVSGPAKTLLASYQNTQAMLIGISSMIAVSLEPQAIGEGEITFSAGDV